MPVELFVESATKVLIPGLVPNQGPTFENLVFDPAYYSMTALIVCLVSYAAVSSFRSTGFISGLRERATGTGFVALGVSAIFVASTLLLLLRRTDAIGGVSYLQTQFSVDYLACAVILYGVGKASSAGARARKSCWLAFLASVLVAISELSNSLSYTVTVTGAGEEVAQQLIFWLPCFVAVTLGAGLLSFRAMYPSDSEPRAHTSWLSLAFLFVFAGLLRESTIIPSSGDPLVDLLLAFVPFVLAALSIAASAHKLRAPQHRPLQPIPSDSRLTP